jgi:hypothetical protein
VNYWEKPEVNQIELILGFKVNHMRTIQVDDMIEKPLTRKHENAAYFVDALYKGDLFCTRADYQKSLIAQPLWTWFMVGHGYTGETIVDIPINDFKKLLDFASTRITMRLLAYLTCYGAGINTELLYNDEKTGIQKTYPFAIVTQAITDSQTWGYIHKEASSSREVMEEYTERPYDFDTFIKLSEKRDIDYEEILGCLFNIIPKKNFPGNIAQIKLPGIEWFSTVAGKQDVVSIGSVMSRTRTAPLNIQRFFTKKSAKANPARVDPKALLLETTYIPFEIIINGSSLEYIISMVPMPGMASIYIAALKSSVHDINKILDLIQRINGYDTKWLNKRFYISRITALNDKDQLTEYRDVVVFPNGYTYFKQGSNIYYKRMVDEKAIDENSEEGREVVSCLRDHYSEETFDAIKSEAYNYSKKLDVGTTEQTEGLSPENISKLEELFKKRSAAAAVGKLAASE